MSKCKNDKIKLKKNPLKNLEKKRKLEEIALEMSVTEVNTETKNFLGKF
jgi:hypothetical protein